MSRKVYPHPEHVYTPDQYRRVVNAWQSIVDSHLTTVCADTAGAPSVTNLDEETLYALIMTDGSETNEMDAYTVILASYGDYYGSDLDVANIRFWDANGQPGVNCGVFGRRDNGGSAWMQLGELPIAEDSTVEYMVDLLEDVAEQLVWLADYPLLDDETHSAYINELAEEAWDAWLRLDVPSEVEDLVGHPLNKAEREQSYVDDHRDLNDILRATYYAYEHNEWTAETATSVTNNNHKEAVAYVAHQIFGVGA